MSLKRILVLDGVIAVCRFQDDGTILEGEGVIPAEMQGRLAQFAQWYRRMVAGNTDLFSLFFTNARLDSRQRLDCAWRQYDRVQCSQPGGDGGKPGSFHQ